MKPYNRYWSSYKKESAASFTTNNWAECSVALRNRDKGEQVCLGFSVVVEGLSALQQNKVCSK